ncbi:MAG: tetraacyldisaccharide 4'-kinase [Rhodocyclaceae bacterium]|nr:tetraacyldisaccharide 4'-kinase [Rhodocyclaceae bacterium]
MPRSAPQFWQGRGLLAWLWLPLAGLFYLIAQGRRRAYQAGWLRVERLSVPVVVVGNLAAGGSGKTPVVAWLVEVLRRAGYQPGIVSRGYGGQVAGTALVGPRDDPARCGDEPVLLASLTGCPVAVGADRPAAARLLLASHPGCDVIISDDGLQHYRLGREVEIAVVDEVVLGNQLPLPAGPLREPLRRLAEVDLVIANGPLSAALGAQAATVPVRSMTLRGEEFLNLAVPERRVGAAAFAGRRVHGVAGIGRPERFFQQLESMGLTVERHPFPDHHPFRPEDLAFAPGEPKILTAKDGVKCARFATPDLWVFPVRAEIGATTDSGIAADHLILEKLRHGPPIA